MADLITAPPLLSLDTLSARQCVAIDGVSYALRGNDDFSIIEYRQQMRQSARLSTLLGLIQQDALTDDDAAESTDLLDQCCRRVLSAPADVHARLSDGQRIAILNAFVQLPSVRRQTAGAPTAMAAGMSSSPDSSGSTAATQ